MIIKTKLDIGDEAFYVKNNKVASDRIEEVLINVYNNHYMEGTTIWYIVQGKTKFKEDQLFGTKQELLESL